MKRWGQDVPIEKPKQKSKFKIKSVRLIVEFHYDVKVIMFNIKILKKSINLKY